MIKTRENKSISKQLMELQAAMKKGLVSCHGSEVKCIDYASLQFSGNMRIKIANSRKHYIIVNVDDLVINEESN